MIRSKICDILGIRYPVFQGGMAWIADGKLAAAVSEGGGLGIIAAGNAPGSYVREQIRIAKEKTDRPFGVNIMLMSPFADEVAKELAAKNVRCNAVAPGFIKTDMTEAQAENPLLNMIPLGRMGEADEVAEAVAYLINAKYVTGTVLCVDGGIAM